MGAPHPQGHSALFPFAFVSKMKFVGCGSSCDKKCWVNTHATFGSVNDLSFCKYLDKQSPCLSEKKHPKKHKYNVIIKIKNLSLKKLTALACLEKWVLN